MRFDAIQSTTTTAAACPVARVSSECFLDFPRLHCLQGVTSSDNHAVASLTIGSMRPRGPLSLDLGSAASISDLLPRGYVGVPYSPSFTLLAILRNIVAPYSLYSNIGLPGVTVVSNTGKMFGTPSLHGTFSFNFSIYDKRLPYSLAEFPASITIAPVGSVILAADFAAPLASAWLLRGAAAASSDSFGSFLRLTDGAPASVGSAEYRVALPVADGLDIRFSQAHFDGAGGEGIAFYLRDGASTSTEMGTTGTGGLGFAPDMPASVNDYNGYQAVPGDVDRGGMPDGLVAVGMSASGLFSSVIRDGTGCGHYNEYYYSVVPNKLSLRGGSVGNTTTAGYCGTGSKAIKFSSGSDDSAAASRFNRTRSFRVMLGAVSDSNRRLIVYATETGTFRDGTRYIDFYIDEYIATHVPWLARLATATSVYLGFSAEAGSGNNKHAIFNLEVATLQATTRSSRATGTTWVADNFTAAQLASSVWRTSSSVSGSSGTVSTQADSDGTYLRLTNGINVTATIELRSPVPLSHGLDVRFVQAQVGCNRFSAHFI